LPATMVFFKLTAPTSLAMPPPNPTAVLLSAVLLVMVLFAIVAVPRLLRMPPPSLPALLPLTVLLVSVRVPL
jgi:hypothetical protein